MPKSTISIDVDRKHRMVKLEIGPWKGELTIRTRAARSTVVFRWIGEQRVEELGHFGDVDKAMSAAFEVAHTIALGTSFAMLRRPGQPVTEMSTRDIIELSGCSIAWVYRALGIVPKLAFARQ